MDLTVCHKQIEEEWRLQIIVVAKLTVNLAVSRQVLTWKYLEFPPRAYCILTKHQYLVTHH